MANKRDILLIALIFAVGHIAAEQGIHATRCGLEGIEPNSAATPIRLPPVAENLQSGQTAWRHPTFGPVKRNTVDPTDHYTYLTAQLDEGNVNYFMNGNAKTKDFVKDKNTRLMIRNINIYCDDETRVRYYFVIPFQDVEPPVFAETEYTMNIDSNWASGRPISEGQFVTVSDNTGIFESEALGGRSLKFVPSPDILTVVAHPLWVLPNPTSYFFRLDLFLKDNAGLQPGQNLQIILSALDDYNTATTKININVSD